jgi:hypothetical protein
MKLRTEMTRAHDGTENHMVTITDGADRIVFHVFNAEAATSLVIRLRQLIHALTNETLE